MVDRLLRVHIQSQRAFGPWWTLSYNKGFLRNNMSSGIISCLHARGISDLPMGNVPGLQH